MKNSVAPGLRRPHRGVPSTTGVRACPPSSGPRSTRPPPSRRIPCCPSWRDSSTNRVSTSRPRTSPWPGESWLSSRIVWPRARRWPTIWPSSASSLAPRTPTSSSCRTSPPPSHSSRPRSLSCSPRDTTCRISRTSPPPTRRRRQQPATPPCSARPSTRCCVRATLTVAPPPPSRHMPRPIRTAWASGPIRSRLASPTWTMGTSSTMRSPSSPRARTSTSFSSGPTAPRPPSPVASRPSRERSSTPPTCRSMPSMSSMPPPWPWPRRRTCCGRSTSRRR